MDKVLIFGSSGLARELTCWSSDQFSIVGYSGENPEEHQDFSLPGKFFPAREVTPDLAGTDLIFVTVGSPASKEKIYGELSARGFKFPSFVHPSSVVSQLANIGEGVIISPGCMVSPHVNLGRLAYLNFSCGIGHDSVMGDFTQINPGVQVGGNVTVGRGVLLGSGATVLQGVTIGDNATVASGSTVFSKVSEGATVLGNPARRIRAFDK